MRRSTHAGFEHVVRLAFLPKTPRPYYAVVRMVCPATNIYNFTHLIAHPRQIF
jgi:hypothetical protein